MNFATEEEREAAMAAIPTDPPEGVKIVDWEKETEVKIKEIEDAEIGEAPPADGKAPPDEASEDNGEMEMMRLQQERKDAEAERIGADDRQRIKALEEELKKVRTTEKASNAEDEIKNVRSEIEEIIGDLEKTNDPLDEDYIRKIKKQANLNFKLQGLIEKKNEDRDKEHKQELENLRSEQRLITESDNKKTAKKATADRMEDFRNKHDELKGPSYDKMDTEYADFSVKVANTYYGELSKTKKEADAQIEVAMQKYVEGTPVLLEKLATQRVKEPEGLKQYLLLTELDAMDQGYVINKATGEWVKYTNRSGTQMAFLSLDDVYDHYKKSKGITAKEMIEQQRVGEKKLLDAVNKRADITELDSAHVKQDVGEMSVERATEVVEDADPALLVKYGRKDMNHPYIIEFNKASVVRGEAPITRESLG